MKFHRSRFNRMIRFLSFRRKILLFFLIPFLLLILYLTANGNQIDSFESIQWSGIPIYVPYIPNNIIQTSKYSFDVNNITNSFIRLNPTYTYFHYNDSSADKFVRERLPDYIYQTYRLLPEPILKADYFRYIVLLVQGGIYSDIDTICLRSINTWIDGLIRDHTELIVGIEADVSLWDVWKGYYARKLQFVQWTIAAAPGHPVLYQIVKHIARITPSMIDKSRMERQILEWTGPALWTDVISSYFWTKYQFSLRHLKNLNEPKRIGDDIYVLPITAFSPGLQRMNSKPITHPQACVQHQFANSWKNLNKNKSA